MFPIITIPILDRQIGSYGVCAFVGLLACGLVAAWLGKRRGVAYEDVILTILIAAGGLLVGAHALYGVTNADKIVALLAHAGDYAFLPFVVQLGTYFGGMVFYGGFIGAAIAVRIYAARAKALEVPVMMDLLAVSIPLFHTFGRVGCFLAGCCYGIESPFGFLVEHNDLSPDVCGVTRFPVQLVEAACNLLIFLFLCEMFRRGRRKGDLIYVYMLFYPPVRFVLEFWRGDVIRGFLLGLSTSQWVSILLFVYAVLRLTVWRRRDKSAASEA